MKLEIGFGAMMPTIKYQLLSHDFDIIDEGLLEHCQKDADAVSRLKIRGILSSSAAKTAEKKILKNIRMCV